MNQKILRERTERFLKTLGLPISSFAKSIGIDRSTYYRWKNGEFNFGERRYYTIDEYLKKYGF